MTACPTAELQIDAVMNSRDVSLDPDFPASIGAHFLLCAGLVMDLRSRCDVILQIIKVKLNQSISHTLVLKVYIPLT